MQWSADEGSHGARDGRARARRVMIVATLVVTLACGACGTVERLPRCHGPSQPINGTGSTAGSAAEVDRARR